MKTLTIHLEDDVHEILLKKAGHRKIGKYLSGLIKGNEDQKSESLPVSSSYDERLELLERKIDTLIDRIKKLEGKSSAEKNPKDVSKSTADFDFRTALDAMSDDIPEEEDIPKDTRPHNHVFNLGFCKHHQGRYQGIKPCDCPGCKVTEMCDHPCNCNGCTEEE